MLPPLDLQLFGDEQAPATSASCREQALRYLAAIDPLYAVVDAARSPAILPLLTAGDALHESLLSSEQIEALAPWGPFLVALGGSPLLPQLVRQGWGEAWGIYLTSPRPFKALRRHLARQLQVEHQGVPALFRFYDPRVLREQLAGMPQARATELMGPIAYGFVEAAEPDALLVFHDGDQGVTTTRVALADAG